MVFLSFSPSGLFSGQFYPLYFARLFLIESVITSGSPKLRTVLLTRSIAFGNGSLPEIHSLKLLARNSFWTPLFIFWGYVLSCIFIHRSKIFQQLHWYLTGFLLLTLCLMPPFCRGKNNRCTPNWCTFSHFLLLRITSYINTYNPNDIWSVVWNSRFCLSQHIQVVFRSVMFALLSSRW